MFAIVEGDSKRLQLFDDVANGRGTTMLAPVVQIEKRNVRNRKLSEQFPQMLDMSNRCSGPTYRAAS